MTVDDSGTNTRQAGDSYRPEGTGTLVGAGAVEASVARRRPRKLEQPVQFIVEGADAWEFWTGLARRLELSAMQVHDFRGIAELRQYLRTVQHTPGWEGVRTLVIGRDCEQDAQAALQSVQSHLSAANLPVPLAPFSFEGSGPRVAILLWPAPVKLAGSNVWMGTGTLEDLCLSCIPQDDLVCADRFLQCVEGQRGPLKRRHKARLQAYLAGTDHAGLQFRDATAAGAWDLDSGVMDPFIALLNSASADPTATGSAA